MRQKLLIVCALLFCASLFAADQPLRVFLRAGKKTHGPAGNGQHDGPTFLKEWKKMLTDRGAVVDGAIGFPTAEQLEKTDVIVFYTEEGGTIKKEDRDNLDKFLKRGGGIVAIHDSVCGNDAQWWKTIIGGAWEHGHSKWLEAEVPIYYVGGAHPITTNCSNFEFDDEIYYDLHMMPEVKVIAGSWTPDRRNTRNGRVGQHIYDVAPQMWTYEKGHRAFVSIPGHHWKSFEMPHFRAVLLRGVAWAGRRDVDSLLKREEIASLRYPEGGPTAPDKALSLLELHPEFNIRVFAAEPLITKPINIDWDPAGRMWVAETPEYPNGRRGIRFSQGDSAWKDHGGLVNEPGKQDRPAYDRISIVTDTNGDGVADRKHVFFEGLELVTGFVFHKDGVIVAQAPDILWLRDVDRDGKAEKVEKLYTGLGIADTHAVINNLRWGFDGWVYATHGYSAGNVMSGDGNRSYGRIGSGVVRFKPDGSAFEQYSSKGGNTWGLDITSDNEVMFTQPTSDDLLNHVVQPESALARGKVGNTSSYKAVIHHRKSNPLIKHENLAYVQIDLVGLFTAAAGAAIYEHGSWPEQWHRSYFTTEPTINILHHEIVKPQGVTFTADKTREEEFVGGRDEWYRPIETRIGPDGALYVLDFYNQAVIHNDTRGPQHNAVNAAVRPDRDHYFGRIHRINHKQAKNIPVPDLSKANTEELVKALEHPNRAVRMTAHRLLVEGAKPEAIAALKQPAGENIPAVNRIHRLWVMHLLGELSSSLLTAGANDPSPEVRKNALQIAALASNSSVPGETVLRRLRDDSPRVKLEALNALAAHAVDKAACEAIIAEYPKFQDRWLESAAVAALSQNPGGSIAAALAQSEPGKFQDLVSILVAGVAEKGSPDAVSALVVAAAQAPASAGALRVAILQSLNRELKRDVNPPVSGALQSALRSALTSQDTTFASAALPLASRWDKENKLAPEQKSLAQALLKRLESGSDDVRSSAAANLLGARHIESSIVPSVTRLLGSTASERVQAEVIRALGQISDAAIGKELVAALPKVASTLRDDVFAQIIKRSDSSLALVDALKAGSVTVVDLGPSSLHRLRTHSDSAVANRARTTIDDLRGPEVKEKNAVIAKLAPDVEKLGNAQKGREVFDQNCAVCHMYNGAGKPVGPDLTGMGAHGATELLTAILDPNREVDPSYLAWSFETKDGESYDGVIVTENRSAITLRNNSGEMQLRTSDLESRRNTGRSLMPEGFEALGAEALRDMLTYLAGSDTKYRIIDLRPAFTADTSRGLFLNVENRDDTLRFRKFGLIKAGDVPFEVINPTRTSSGNNIVVLKGGQGLAKTYPQRVQVDKLNIKAKRLHFLGGVAGWGWPCCGPNGNKNLPAAKIIVTYSDSQTEEFTLKNGVEIADHVGPIDVPGSKGVDGLLSRGQVRTFSRDLTGKAPIQSITLTSFDNEVAPAFVAITAETGDVQAVKVADATGNTVGAAPASAIKFSPRATSVSAVRGLIVGGGSSHDFDRWFNKEDKKTILELNPAWFDYISDPQQIASALPNLDVLYLSNNQPIKDKASREGIFQFADAGRTLLLIHPALWYNWADWPEYNRVLVGGGSRGHDKFGEFEVKITQPNHPLMKGVAESFKITDELYYFIQDTNGTPIDVLATGTSPVNGKTWPVAWVTKHPKAKIFCLTLGHDGKSHEHPAYKQMLHNAVRWSVAP